MKSRYATGKDLVKKAMVIIVLGFLITSGTCLLLFNKTLIPISKASSENIAWNATLRIIESGGSGIEVVFGEASDALDGGDEYDMPEPPFPPQLPYIIAKFNTSMEEPLNNLLYEYKKYPDDYKVWYLLILWQPEPGNHSSTTITISWDPLQLAKSEYTSITLYKDSTSVSDMFIDSNYTFDSPPSTLQRFQIICQSKTSDSNETPFLPIIFILIILILFTFYKKKNN